jgi:hypothetical protein
LEHERFRWCAWCIEHCRSATIDLLREDARQKAGEHVNDTDELIYELQDQVQRGNQMLARLCEQAGIDPAEAGRLPGEAAEAVKAA